MGLHVPETALLTSRDDLVRIFEEDDGCNQVFKPVYSRFASQTVVRPSRIEALDGIEPTPRKPWVAQEYLAGRPFATFSIAHRGRITAHATYATDFCHGFGPTIVYRRVEQPAIFEWIELFIKSVGYTGQIGFDFIEDEMGGIAAIECNPRLTGGIYLLKDDPRFAAAYFDPAVGPIEATRLRSYTFRFWLLVTLFRHTKYFPGFREWCRHFLFGRSTHEFQWSDPLPRVMVPVVTTWYLMLCLVKGQSARSLVTRDFEWNEERSLPTTIAAIDDMLSGGIVAPINEKRYGATRRTAVLTIDNKVPAER
jgi:ATP-grasp domain